MINLIGWVGSVSFAICAIPQAWQSFKSGQSTGVNWAFLLLWLLGEVSMIVYVLPKRDYPLLFNYIGNMISLVVIIYYKIRGKNA